MKTRSPTYPHGRIRVVVVPRSQARAKLANRAVQAFHKYADENITRIKFLVPQDFPATFTRDDGPHDSDIMEPTGGIEREYVDLPYYGRQLTAFHIHYAGDDFWYLPDQDIFMEKAPA